MGNLRQQPQGALLRVERSGSQTTRRGNRALGADHRSGERRPREGLGCYPAMRSFKAMLHRVGGLFRRNKLEAGMRAEMQAHLDVLTERNLAAGMSSDEARHAALREFGGVAQFAEQARDERRSLWA